MTIGRGLVREGRLLAVERHLLCRNVITCGIALGILGGNIGLRLILVSYRDRIERRRKGSHRCRLRQRSCTFIYYDDHLFRQYDLLEAL